MFFTPALIAWDANDISPLSLGISGKEFKVILFGSLGWDKVTGALGWGKVTGALGWGKVL